MKNRRLSVEVSRTINTGNYESLRLQASLEVDIPETADLQSQYEELWKTVEDEIAKKLEMLWEPKKPVPTATSSRIRSRKPKVRH